MSIVERFREFLFNWILNPKLQRLLIYHDLLEVRVTELESRIKAVAFYLRDVEDILEEKGLRYNAAVRDIPRSTRVRKGTRSKKTK